MPQFDNYMKQPFKPKYSGLNWEDVRNMVPKADENEDVVNEVAHASPKDPEAENHSAWDLKYSIGHINPQHIDQWEMGGQTHDRVERAKDGYTSGAEMPHVLLVRRAGELRPADGSHRTRAAAQAGVKSIPAVVTDSPRPEPFGNFRSY